MMMVKGACEVSRSFQHVDPDLAARQFDLRPLGDLGARRAASAAGRGPTIEDLQRGQAMAAGAVAPPSTGAPETDPPAQAVPKLPARIDPLGLTVGEREHRRRGDDAGPDPRAKSPLTRSRTGVPRRSASKRSRSRPSSRARCHRCGSSRRAWSANSGSCISQKRP